ncbi:MAG TPA: glycosyltransferase family 4 protein [Gemmatimonadaceae bacterium]|nr:glycosyltransferase family 4 protein [Gemmatimonadaceae bacterium]
MRMLYLCADRGITLDKHNGATAHFRSLVRAFRSSGHDVHVLTPSNADESALGASVGRIPAPPMLVDLLASVDVSVPRQDREALRARKRVIHAVGHVWNNVATEQQLDLWIDRFEPDFVFELYSPFGVAGVLTCNRRRVPHVLNVHAPLAWEGATFRSQALQEAAETLEEIALRNAQRIVANSEEMRRALISSGVDASKIDVVINGVHLDLFTPDGEVRRAGGNGAVVVGFSGSLKAWHGVEFLADAFRQAAAADERLHLVVVGDGPLRSEIARLATDLPGRVTSTGALPLEEVPAWMRGMDIAVAPYPKLDPFYFSPLKILDAMACGVCNVASNIGQIPELLRHDVTGILVEPGNADELALAILRAAADAELRKRLGAAALAEARERHSWQSRAADIVSIATRLMPVAGAA